MPGKHLVLAGAGHAHMEAIASIAEFKTRNIEVTVVGADSFHAYSGMGPGVLGGNYSLEDIRFCSRDQVERRGGIFLEDQIVSIDASKNRLSLSSGKKLGYDVLSCNLGSQVKNSIEHQGGIPEFPVKPISNLDAAGRYLTAHGRTRRLHIAIVGGGGSATEIAGNLTERCLREELTLPEITIYCRGGYLSGNSQRVREYCRNVLTSRGIRIREGIEVAALYGRRLQLTMGETEDVDMVFYAQGIEPSPLFKESGLQVGDDGGLLVNRYLQSYSTRNVFGGGDCICFAQSPLDRVGVHAVRQNKVLVNNLLAFLENRPLQPFVPVHTYLMIYNLGKKCGVAQRGGLFVSGRFAFWLKDTIDRRFIRQYR